MIQDLGGQSPPGHPHHYRPSEQVTRPCRSLPIQDEMVLPLGEGEANKPAGSSEKRLPPKKHLELGRMLPPPP
jgi:hypothetical protein